LRKLRSLASSSLEVPLKLTAFQAKRIETRRSSGPRQVIP
jgi:hypothetical protein